MSTTHFSQASVLLDEKSLFTMTALQICTACGQPAIASVHTPIPHLKCGHCQGMGLPAASAKKLLLEVAKLPPPVVGEAVRNATESPQHCFACKKKCSTVFLKEHSCQLCQSCGALWLAKGGMNALSQGQWPETERSPVPPNAVEASFDIGLGISSNQKLTVEPVAAAAPFSEEKTSGPKNSAQKSAASPEYIASKNIVSLSQPTQSSPRKQTRTALVEGTGGKNRGPLSSTVKMAIAASSLVATVVLGFALVLFLTAPPPHEEPQKEEDFSKEDLKNYEVYFINYLFGGQTLEWWTKALQESHATGAKPDPVRHQSLLSRIPLLGLTVEKSENTSEAGEVKIGSTLLKTLATHLGLK